MKLFAVGASQQRPAWLPNHETTRVSAVMVTGGRGKTGREVVARLTNVQVRAGTRTPEPAGGCIEPVAFDWDVPAGWAAAASGVDAIYVMRPDIESAPERVAALVDLVPDAHVVLLSEQGAGDLPPTSWERQVELAVTERADSWTLLRPSWFHQVLTDERFFLGSIRDDGELAFPSGGSGIAWVDARDIAAAAVAALSDPAVHAARAYTITGPEAVPVADVATLLSNARGSLVTPGDPAAADALASLDTWLAGVLTGMYGRVRAGVFGTVTDDVEAITSHPARPLGAFIADHAGAWRGSLPTVAS